MAKPPGIDHPGVHALRCFLPRTTPGVTLPETASALNADGQRLRAIPDGEPNDPATRPAPQKPTTRNGVSSRARVDPGRETRAYTAGPTCPAQSRSMWDGSASALPRRSRTASGRAADTPRPDAPVTRRVAYQATDRPSGANGYVPVPVRACPFRLGQGRGAPSLPSGGGKWAITVSVGKIGHE